MFSFKNNNFFDRNSNKLHDLSKIWHKNNETLSELNLGLISYKLLKNWGKKRSNFFNCKSEKTIQIRPFNFW